jgi:hypothetical protein
MPDISPSTTGATTYTINGSKGVIADLSLNVTLIAPVTFSVTYPTAAAGVQVELSLGATILNLLPPVTNNLSFANRRVSSTTTAVGPNTTLTCTIEALAAAGVDPWVVRVSGLAGGTCVFTQGENDPMSLTITRIMCDPVAVIATVAPPSPVNEKVNVTLTASLATGPALTPTVVGLPAPVVTYRWTYIGQIAINEFPAEGPSQTLPFVAPGVYAAQTIQVTLQVWFGAPGPVGFLNNTSPVTPLTINPIPQRLALVLDRSGSMSGAKWENAKTAARILTHLFIALRQGVSANDRVGLVVFEDTTCSWHLAPINAGVSTVMNLSDTATADGLICPLNFGPAGSCTPIGDGLYRGMELLNSPGAPTGTAYTIILLTDGYENSGTIRVDPNTPTGGVVVRNFSAARTDFPTVNANLKIFAVGLGATVQEDVLDALPLPMGAGPSGIYRHVTDVDQLEEAIEQMVTMSQEAQQIVPFAGAPPEGDPAPLAQQRYFQLDPGVARLALSIEWTNAADTIELAKRDMAGGVFSGSFSPVAATVKGCPTHGFVTVDLAALFGGETNVPATQWRVVHRTGGVPQVIADANLMVFVDLYVKADIVFNKERYQTGEPMTITARLRAGDQIITGATVSVELARPGESLGTFLATNAQGFQLPGPIDRPRDPDSTQPRPGDAHHPKQIMLMQLLKNKGWDSLPIVRPPGIFTDGSRQLFDDGAHSDGRANDGNYANVYTDTLKEGTYTWRFYIEGQLADGSRFNRLITISKWVGVNVDTLLSNLNVTYGLAAPRGFSAAQVIVRPVDAHGNYLGPFRTADLSFKTSAGNFLAANALSQPTDGMAIDQADGAATISHFDGRYSRVLVYPSGPAPIVTVSVQDKPFVPVVIARGCLGELLLWVRKLWQWLAKVLTQ